LFIEDRVPARQLGTGYGRTELIVRALLKRADVDILACSRREDDILPEGFNYIDILYGPERLEQRLTSHHYDAVYICRPHNIAGLEQILNQWRRGGGSVVYDTEAIFAVREIARSEQCESYKAITGGTQFAELIESELSPAGIADTIIAVNKSEVAILRRYFDRPVLTIGHYLPTRPIEQELSMRSGLLFVGALTDANSPNYDSLLWFLDRVWPQIRAKRPQETLLIIGHTRSGVPLDALRREGVITLGFVDDLAKAYATARVFIAPTRFAAGVPFKVHEALSYGLPVVGSRLIAEQLLADDETSPGLMPATVVDDGQEFAESCLTLLTDDKLWHEKQRVALKYMRSVCAPSRLDDALGELLSQIRPRPIIPLTKSYAEWIRIYDTLGVDSRQAILKRISMLAYRPLISIVVPLFNTPEPWLRRCIESVREQLYQNWQLCLVDDGSTLLHVASICQEFAALDSRIHFVRRKENGHIAVATNAALKIAEGEFVAFLDHDDELAEHALYMVAEALEENPALDMIFSDEDKINEQGTRYDPWFKSDWNYDLMLSQNVVVHLAVYRRRILEEIGGCREGFDGSQDYDLTLRFIEHTSPDRIRHLPYILYHWRAIPGSVALAPNQKEYAYEAAARAVQDHLNRTETGAVVERERHPGYYRIHWPLPAILPKVTIIIPTKDRVDLLMESVQSILNKTHYPNFDILIVNNQSLKPKTKDYLSKVAQNPKISVLDYDQPYRYAALNNWAVQQLDTPLLAFVNNDIEVVSPNWLSEMVSHALRRNVGAVGAKLYYPNGTIQHAGIVAGIGGLAGHPHQGLERGHPGYFGRAVVAQQFSAVTAACMVMRRNVFLELDGFDDKAFAIAFNDVDLGLRLNRAGYSVVWTPYAELIHHESASLGPPDSPERKTQFERECRMLRLRWTGGAYTDPFYNPNLTIEGGDFSLAFPPRLLRPWDDKVQ
jgi:O-antigen biosynthesis protein